MSITDVNTAPGLTPVSYPNQAFTNINPNRQLTIIMNPPRRNQQLFYTIFLYSYSLVFVNSLLLCLLFHVWYACVKRPQGRLVIPTESPS